MPKQETEDLKTILLCLLVVPLTWVALGWNFSDCIPANDATNQSVMIIRDFQAGGNDWRNVLYRPDILGGVRLFDAGNLLAPYRWFSYLHLSPVTVLNLTSLMMQCLLGFFAIRAAEDLAYRRLELWARLGAIWCVAFAPFVGWRLGYGHHNLVLGIVAFVAGMSWVAAVSANRLSVVFSLISALSFFGAFASGSQQSLLYDVVFGAPIVIGLALSLYLPAPVDERRRLLKRAGFPLLVAVAAFGLSAPVFSGTLSDALSSDTTRTLHGVSIIYSYTTATLREWLLSLGWSERLAQAGGRPYMFWHECNVPLGPILVLLCFVPWRRFRPLAVGLLAGTLIAVLFSTHLTPFSDLLPSVIPALKAFRSPNRAEVPIASAVAFFAPVALAWFCVSDRKPARWEPWTWAGAGVVFFFLPSIAREVLLWAALFVLVASKSLPWSNFLRSPGLMLFVGIASLASFGERLPHFTPRFALEQIPEHLSSAILTKAPSLKSPLNRAIRDIEMPVFGRNLLYGLGISSVDGYWYPTSRFNRLTSALMGLEPSPTAMGYYFGPDNPWLAQMIPLYNIIYELHGENTETGELRLVPIPGTIGPAWFTRSLRRVASDKELAEQIKSAGSKLSLLLPHQGWVVSSDSDVPPNLQEDFGPDCSQAEIKTLKMSRATTVLDAEVNSPSTCPLVLSMNYVSLFQAINSDTHALLPVFPVYGALTGVLVPPGSTHFTLRAVEERPLWATALWWLGLSLLGVGLWFQARYFGAPAARDSSAIESAKLAA